MTSAGDRAAAEVRAALDALDLEWTESAPGLFSVSLPGTRKLRTECALEVGDHALSLRAFVARRPEENHAGVYRWLLERNLKLSGIGFALDALGDVHLVGRVPLAAVTADLVDQLLGSCADAADTSFNTILELGFAASIRAEWVWRRSRGESVANLAAFGHLDPERQPGPAADAGLQSGPAADAEVQAGPAADAEVQPGPAAGPEPEAGRGAADPGESG